VLWFPFLQPLAEASLGGRSPGLLIVQVLGVSYLLKNAAFLLLWFAALWVILKWHTQRRVIRAIARWKSAANLDPSLSLAGQSIEWAAGLIEPIRSSRQRMEDLVRQCEQMRTELAAA
jgi:hypothetical protein